MLDHPQKPSGKESADREQNLSARDTVAFEKEREEKDDGRYIIYYTFGDNAREEEGAGP